MNKNEKENKILKQSRLQSLKHRKTISNELYIHEKCQVNAMDKTFNKMRQYKKLFLNEVHQKNKNKQIQISVHKRHSSINQIFKDLTLSSSLNSSQIKSYIKQQTENEKLQNTKYSQVDFTLQRLKDIKQEFRLIKNDFFKVKLKDIQNYPPKNPY